MTCSTPVMVKIGNVLCPLVTPLALQPPSPDASPSMSVHRDSPRTGLVGRFLKLAPNLLQDGRSSVTLPPRRLD